MPLPTWTAEELASIARESEELAMAEREARMTHLLESRFEAVATALRDLLAASDNLGDLNAVVDLVDAGASRAGPFSAGPADAVRLLTMPPLPPRLEESYADAAAEAGDTGAAREQLKHRLVSELDERRFPWVVPGRRPTECELESAVLATGTLAVAQSLPIFQRRALIEQEGRFFNDLRRLGWEEMPRGTPVHRLPEETFVAQPRSGPDLAARFPDSTLALVEVKAALRQRALSKAPVDPLLRAFAGLAPRDLAADRAPERVLVLYGALPLARLIELQELGIRIVFGHQVNKLFALEEQRTLAAGEAEPTAQMSPGEAVGERTELITAEQVIRQAALRLSELIPADTTIGRLGRRKGQPSSDGYLGQYVHIQAGEPLAVWIYYARKGHPYSAPSYPSGYWVGLKRDPARELPDARWQTDVPEGFEYTEHIESRYAGLRHFFRELSVDTPVEGAAEEIARRTFGALEASGWVET